MPVLQKELKLKTKAVIIGDVHFPFHSHEAVDKALALIKDLQPDMVIQIGDLYDFFSYSKYPRTLNLILPEDECRTARECAEIFWAEVHKASPRSKRVQLAGNHDDRLLKRVLDVSPAHEHIARKYLNDMLTFDGVETIFNSKDEFVYDGVCYIHGYRKSGEHAPFNQMNTVVGHLHRGALHTFTNFNGTYWELNAGWLGDKNNKVFSYRAQNKISMTTLGVGVIDDLGPRFVLLE